MKKFTFYDNPTLTLVCWPAATPVRFSLEATANLTGVHAELLRYYCQAGLIDHFHGMAEAELFFDEGALQEVRHIEYYRRHLGVGRRALALVCELRREGERQHIELPFLRQT